MGVGGFGMGLMLKAGMIASHIGSYVGENKLLEQLVIAGKLQVALIPQGTLQRSVLAARAFLPSTLPPASAPLLPKVKNLVNSTASSTSWNTGSKLILRWSKRGRAIATAISSIAKLPVILIPMMATAARITVAEVEELVEPGELEPDEIMTPGVFVKRIVKGEQYQHRIERRTVRTA